MRPWVVVACTPKGFHESVGRWPLARAWTEAEACRLRQELWPFAPADGWLEVCHRRDWRTPMARVLDQQVGRIRHAARRARTA